ncbi:MAG: DUF6232 family protein [Vulcanimicrobiaceae bacterium]
METVLYEDHAGTFISPSRVVMNGVTYSVANITSVRVQKNSRAHASVIVMFVIGLIAGFNHATGTALFFFAIAFLLLLGIKPTWSVIIGTTAGERSALQSKDAEAIRTIVNALNEAIVAR